MRKQIAAANWKMNLTLQQAETLIKDVLALPLELKENQEAVFGIPFPYLMNVQKIIAGKNRVYAAAQNCSTKVSGAFTGEVSVEMLKSIGVPYVIIGHSERREYFKETNSDLSQKVNLCFEYGLKPIFC
ncbi:MAG: triose-phosphate isomerase, partial [Ferruginibacter sp.]